MSDMFTRPLVSFAMEYGGSGRRTSGTPSNDFGKTRTVNAGFRKEGSLVANRVGCLFEKG